MKRSPAFRFIKTCCHAALCFAITLTCVSRKSLAEQPLLAPALRPGDTVVIVAPAGPMHRSEDQADIARAEKILRDKGLDVRRGDDLFRQTGYLAGSDEVRVNELNAALRNPDVDAVFAGRGGFGLTRILDQIDYDAVLKHPKIILGFSDITALHIAVNERTGLVTFHSPNAVWGLGNKKGLPPPAKHFFWRALWADRYGNEPGYLISATDWSDTFDEAQLKETCDLEPPKTMCGGRAQGRLTGGNLSLVAALMGTPYEPDTDGKILFLEDIGEAPYRIDRMLSTLRLAGKLGHLEGVVLGQFTWRADQEASEDDVTTDDVLTSYFKPLGIPVIKNFPAGHLECNITLPIGALCEIDADRQTLTLLENPVRVDTN